MSDPHTVTMNRRSDSDVATCIRKLEDEHETLRLNGCTLRSGAAAGSRAMLALPRAALALLPLFHHALLALAACGKMLPDNPCEGCNFDGSDADPKHPVSELFGSAAARPCPAW